MHIPDGFLSMPVIGATAAASAVSLGVASRRAQAALPDTRIPLMGVMGAFVFAAQMINFPVGPGTSGHLVGGTLLAAVLGAPGAMVVMTAILALQALVFQDGGILALGANVFNMAVAGVLAGSLPYRLLDAHGWRRTGLFVGGVLSAMVSATLTLGQLLASAIAIPRELLWLSLGLFLISAVLEGAITVAVAGALERMNPAWLRKTAPREGIAGGLRWVAAGAMLITVVGVLFASSLPDGLEDVAEKAGFAGQARNLFATPLSDYEFSLVKGDWLRKASAGLAGLILVYGACLMLGRLVIRPRGEAGPAA